MIWYENKRCHIGWDQKIYQCHRFRPKSEVFETAVQPHRRMFHLRMVLLQVKMQMKIKSKLIWTTFEPHSNLNVLTAIGNPSTSASPMISSVTKVVQPTATVSSVPVSGPSMFISRPSNSNKTKQMSRIIHFAIFQQPVSLDQYQPDRV